MEDLELVLQLGKYVLAGVLGMMLYFELKKVNELLLNVYEVLYKRV